MTAPSRGLANRLLDLAGLIAPPHRQDWIEAMRAELGPAGGARLSWAFGCLLTAISQRMSCATPSAGGRIALGLALIVLGCGWIIYLITAGMPMITGRVHRSLQMAAYLGVDLTLWLTVTQCGGALFVSPLGDRPARLGRRIFGLACILFVIARLVFAMIIPPWAGLSSFVSLGAFAIAGLALLLDSRGLLPLLPPLGAAMVASLTWQTLRVMEMGMTGWLLVGFILLCVPYLLVLAIAGALILNPTPRVRGQEILA